MQPNNPPTHPTSQTPLTNIPSPQLSPPPQMPMAPQAPLPPPPSSPVAPSQKSGGGKIALIILGSIGLLLVLLSILGIIAYMFLFSASAQSQATSDEFMSYLTKGDINNALTLTISDSQETRQFLESASAKLQGSYALKDSGDKNSKYYFLYELSGAEYNAARTEVIQENGKWVIEGLVYNKGALALIPGESADQEASAPAPATTASTCLVQSDFDQWYQNGIGLGKTATELGFDFSDPAQAFSTNVKFEADSLNFTQPQVNQSFLEDVAELAESVQGKQYTIRLYGSVATTSVADLDFATQRANKVKADLVSLGVPASNISVENSSNIEAVSDPEFRNNTAKAGARGVHIQFDPTCNGGSTDATGR